MNTKVRTKAARALTTAKLTGDRCWFPKIYIVGEDVYFFDHAAELAVKHGKILDGVTYKIEEMTFEEAWQIRYNREAPIEERIRICKNINKL